MTAKPLTICYFPGRESSYVRTRVLKRGLKEAGAIVYDCSYDKKSVFRYIVGFFRFLKYKHKCDIILVGFLGQFLIPFVRLFTRKKIIFEAFLSTYQTLAFDRKSIKPEGIQASIVRYMEKLSCQLSDMVLLDTHEHINYFIKEYSLDKRKFHRSFLGCDDTIMKQTATPKEDAFLIHFHGEYQALHGTKYIIEAAQLLPDIKFQMVGGGRELEERKKQAHDLGLKNITFIPPVAFFEIPQYMSKANICLGLFGETEKTQLVIPFKVYETLALGKPIITANTPSIKELVTHKENIYLCDCANPKSLAEAITDLKNDPLLREKIAKNGRKIYEEQCSPKIIGEDIIQLANKLLEEKH